MTTEQQKDMWGAICERAGIEREPDDVGPPTHLPMGSVFAWFSTTDSAKPTAFQVGKPSPLKTTFVVVAIFQEEHVVRIYGLPEKPGKPEDNIPLRWTLTKTAPTMFVEQFADPNTFVDAIAAELIACEIEFEDLEDGPEPQPLAPPNGGEPVVQVPQP